MPKKVVIHYDPTKTVAENATNNGVEKSTIRAYIKRNGIDRKGEAQFNIIQQCRKVYKVRTSTQSSVARESGVSLSTVRKYWAYITGEKTFVDFDTKKAKRYQSQGFSKEEVKTKTHVLFSEALEHIPDVLKYAEQEDVSALQKFINEDNNLPMFFIGSGGMQTRCHYGAMLYSTGKGLGQAITPYSLSSLSDDVIKGGKSLIMSSGGENKDAVYALGRCSSLIPSRTGVYYHRDGKDNEMLPIIKERSLPSFRFHNDNIHGDGFVSVQSKFYGMGILFRAFTGASTIDLDIDLNPAACYVYSINKEGTYLPSFDHINHFQVIYGSYAEPVAVDMESVLTESGVSSVQICDYRNYCHGRFMFAALHTRHNELKREVSDVAVVLLQTPRERDIAQRLRKVLPPETPIITIETEHNSPLATIDLLVKANVLIADIAEKYNGINPCDPKNVYGQYFKARPMNNVSFVRDFQKWGGLSIIQECKS